MLLKLDVQGYEAQTLRGGVELLKRVQWVVAEASLKPMYEGEALFIDLVELMRTFGFSFLRPVGWAGDPQRGRSCKSMPSLDAMKLWEEAHDARTGTDTRRTQGMGT